MNASTIFIIVCAIGASCSKSEQASKSKGSAPAKSEAKGVEAETPKGATSNRSDDPVASAVGKTLFTYPPAGAGPHVGFDLEGLRAKLQGTWLVGGSAFSSIPQIWHVSGDELIRYDGGGQRSEHTLELYAPCYARMADKAGSSATYINFVFDGDTLYSGLGNAGLVQDGRTVACVSSGVYVLDGDTCTMWTRTAFPKPGAPNFESEPGECGYEEDGKVFFADDSKAKRSIYGKQKLEVREGDALMTKQMQNNKSEKVESLEAALARQKELLAAKELLTRPPEELVYKDWDLPDAKHELEDRQRVWAVAVDRDGKWKLGSFRFKSADEGTLWLSGLSDRFAPPAFVAKPNQARDFKKGQPIVYRTGMMLWGLVEGVEGDEVTMRYLTGKKVKEKTAKPEMFLPVGTGDFSVGSPVLRQVDGEWSESLVVFDAGQEVYLHAEREGTVEPVAKSELKIISGTKKHKKGDKVLVKQSSGVSPLRWLPGKVVRVLGGGAAYEVKTDSGNTYTQSWAYVSGPGTL